MVNRCSFCWVSICLVGALALLVPAGTARAQINNERQEFNSPTGVFAVPPNPVDYWSLDSGCSPGYIVTGRGDENVAGLRNPMPPSTGTRLVRDLNPGSGNSTIGSICHSYIDPISHVFLSADDGSGTNGQEFYRVLDSLYPVMVLKSDINPGSAGSNPAGLTHHQPGAMGRLYFSADDGTNGREIWISNTELNGTTSEYMVKDINPLGSSNPEGFALTVNSANKLMVFSADDGTNGRELWVTYFDTSTPPVHVTTLVKDINPAAGASSNPQSITTVIFSPSSNAIAFFTADDGANGRELWCTDGTAAKTAMLKDIVAGSGSSNPTNLTPANETVPTALFFTVGNDLWSSKGTAGGADTLLIKSVGGTPTNLTVVYNAVWTSGCNLYFTVGNALWKSDGTNAGTVVVTTFASAPTNLVGAKGTLYFAADDGSGSGVELWKSDTTGTSMLKDINPGAASSSPTNLRTYGSLLSLRFSADDGTNGRELWKSDGTAGGTVMVKDINPGPAGSNPDNLFLSGPGRDILFFTADDGEHGRELWESDGYAEAGDSHVGVGYKWDLESLIESKGDTSKIAIAGTDANVFIVGATFDFPTFGEGLEGLSIMAHQANHYIELSDGTDRAPLNISYVDCGDGNLLRPKAALTDGSNHNAIAFGMVAVLDQDPCDQTPRGDASPGEPFAYVPAIYDGHDWIPMDMAHITPGVTTNPPVTTTLGQAPRTSLYLPAGLPAGLVAATSDPYSQKRYTWWRLEVWTDYIRAVWYSKNTGFIYVATVPRHYKGAFKALYIGTKGGVQSVSPFFFDSLSLNGGLFATSVDPYGACCTAAGCSDVVGNSSACTGGIFSAWKTCGGPTTPICCPVPWADSDRDGDVDMDDFAALQRCLTPSSIPTACACFDKNADGAIDVTDVTKFATCATGSNVALTPGQIAACDTLP